MAKKLFKGVAGIFGKKKKSAAAPAEDGQPIVTPLDGAQGSRPGDKFRRRKGAAAAQTILSQTLGGDAFRGKLGG